MRFEEYLEQGIITYISEIEKEKYFDFLKQAYEDDKHVIDIILKQSIRWNLIISYYTMHDLTKYYLAKIHNLKITGREVHLATIVALKKVVSDKNNKEKIVELITQAQNKYDSLDSSLNENIIPIMLKKGREEREKSQYYTEKKSMNFEDFVIFKENVVKPFIEIIEGLLKND